MKTIFDKDIRSVLIRRIANLSESDTPVWGKMNVLQMLNHNTFWNEWVLGIGEHKYKQAFIGKIFGKATLKKMVGDERHITKNIPTSEQFKVGEVKGSIDSEKHKWIALVHAYENFDNPRFIHDFFGKMTLEEVGILVYKHTDHHLRQFNV